MSTIDVQKLKSVALDIHAVDLAKPYLLIVRVPRTSGQHFIEETARSMQAAAPACNVVVLPHDVTVDAYETMAIVTPGDAHDYGAHLIALQPSPQ